jgi:hypothetical protein
MVSIPQKPDERNHISSIFPMWQCPCSFRRLPDRAGDNVDSQGRYIGALPDANDTALQG